MAARKHPGTYSKSGDSAFLRIIRKITGERSTQLKGIVRKKKVAIDVGYNALENRQLMATLVPGAVLDSTIGAAGEVDVHQFYASAGSIVELAINSRATQVGFRAVAHLMAPNGSYIATISADSFHLENQRFNLNAAGYYTLRVKDNDSAQTGGYSIGLEGLKPSSPDKQPLPKGSVVERTIGRQLEKDQFVFYGAAGSRIDLALHTQSGQAGFRAAGKLVAPSGKIEAQFLSGSTQLASQTIQLKETGTYMFQIQDDDLRQTGTYLIGFEGKNPISPGAVSLVNGGMVSGTISTPLDKRQFTLTGLAGQTYRIAITGQPLQAGFRASASLYSPAGIYIDNIRSSSSRPMMQVTLPQSGTYMLQVGDDTLLERGNFKVSLIGIKPVSPNVSALAYNTTAYRTFFDPLQHHMFTISRTAGQTFTLDLNKSGPAGYDPYCEIFSPSGQSIGRFPASNIRSFTANQTGKYLIVVNDYNFDTLGSFSIRWF